MGKHFLTVFLIAVQEALGIRVVRKDMALFNQGLTNLRMVIDFAVKDHNDISGLVEHRLMSVGKVDDAEPTEAKCGISFDISAGIVRPAMDDSIHHLFQDLFFFFDLTDQSANSTHMILIFLSFS